MWNPDAVLRVEDIHHRPDTQERLDKAAATQMVFEDALIHIIDGLIRTTRSDRLVLTGGVALNAVANMRLLEKFDESYYSRIHGRATRLHLWVPPVPGDAGATVGAPYAFAASVGAGFGPPLQHAFYCGRASTISEILDALENAADVAWFVVGKASNQTEIDAIADLMAFITARPAPMISVGRAGGRSVSRETGRKSMTALYKAAADGDTNARPVWT